MKIEVRLTKIGNAGMYDLVRKENGITDDMILKINKGEPYYYARVEAERLAVLLNCDLIENDKIIRGFISKEIKSE